MTIREHARAIQNHVAAFYGLKPALLRGRRKYGRISWARQVTMVLCMENIQIGRAGVGRLLGVTHEAVRHALTNIRQTCEVDRKANVELTILREQVRGLGEEKETK